MGQATYRPVQSGGCPGFFLNLQAAPWTKCNKYSKCAMSKLQRVFIGIPVDDRCQGPINRLLMPFKRISQDIRWIPEHNRHLTLAFLGNKSKPEIDCLLKAFDETFGQDSAFQFCLSALTRFPGPGGRIIALTGLPCGPLEAIHRATQSLLKKNGIEFDQKRFRPHVTLGYIVKSGQVKTKFDQKTEIFLDVDRVVLYQSKPTASGSIYTRLKETKLGQY